VGPEPRYQQLEKKKNKKNDSEPTSTKKKGTRNIRKFEQPMTPAIWDTCTSEERFDYHIRRFLHTTKFSNARRSLTMEDGKSDVHNHSDDTIENEEPPRKELVDNGLQLSSSLGTSVLIQEMENTDDTIHLMCEDIRSSSVNDPKE